MTYRPSIAERIAWTSGQLQAAEVKVLVALWSCGDFETGRNCRPYIKTIVARSGLSRATVNRTLADLRDEHQPGGPWIIPTSRRHRHATAYDIQIDRLATVPPKEQQMSLSAVLTSPRSEAQNEPQPGSEAHSEPQRPEFEAHFEPPTSDPDLVPDVRTHSLVRAREDDAAPLPILGLTPPPRCLHPHAHAWCEGRVHVPRDLHFEFLAKLDTRPGESAVAKAGRLIAFYADTMTQLPATQAVGESYQFWKAAFVAWISEASRPAPRASAPPREATVWEQVLERLETKVPRHILHTWFLPLVLVADTGAVIAVTRPGPQGGFHADWITKHYREVLDQAVTEVRPGARIDVTIEQERRSG